MTLIRNLADAKGSPVDAPGATGCSLAVLIGAADGASNFAVRQVTVEPAGATPHHSHDYEHEVIVLEGAGMVLDDGQERAIKPGDVVFVQAGHDHQFRASTDAPMRFLCVTPTHSASGEAVPGT